MDKFSSDRGFSPKIQPPLERSEPSIEEFPGASRVVEASPVQEASAIAPVAEELAMNTSESSLEPVWWKKIPTAKRLMIFSALAFLVAVFTLAIGCVYIQQIPESGSAGLGIFSEALSSALGGNPGKRVFEGRERLNILCVGIDYNRDEKGMGYTKGARSDTIFVMSIDSKGQILNIVSIPRDSQVFINEAVGYDKINAAFQVGGIELCKRVVSEFLGVPIHHYVIIKVAGAGKMVDALGGLQVDVEKDMDYDDNWGNLHIHLKKGNQLLNGEQAVGYARFRMDAESDRGRIRRQQQVMMSLVRRLKDPMVVLRLQSIVKAVKENVETDLSVMDMLDLTYLYKDFDRKHMKTGAIVGEDADINGVSYVIPIPAENEKIIRELLKEPSDIRRGEVRVEVVNASGNDEVAGDVVYALQNEGFQVVKVRDAETLSEVTMVTDHVRCGVRSVFESLLGGCIFEEADDSLDNKNQNVDITVVVGTDRVLHGNSSRHREQTENVYDSYVAPRSEEYYQPEPEPAPRSQPEETWSEPEIDLSGQNEIPSASETNSNNTSGNVIPEVPSGEPASDGSASQSIDTGSYSEPAPPQSVEVSQPDAPAPEPVQVIPQETAPAGIPEADPVPDSELQIMNNN